MDTPVPLDQTRAAPSAWCIADHVVWRDMDGELVLFDSQAERYHALNPMGSRIWRALAQGLAPEAIADELLTQFEAPADHIGSGVQAFVANACALGLLRRVEGAA